MTVKQDDQSKGILKDGGSGGKETGSHFEETISPTFRPQLCKYITLQTKENTN